MSQTKLGLFEEPHVDPDTELVLAEYRKFRLEKAGVATVKAEVSQLRSLAISSMLNGIGLRGLLENPALAANLIEEAGTKLRRTTLLTRARAFQELALFLLGDSRGRSCIEDFRASIPQRHSLGWHDAGVSIPGSRNVLPNRAPTPDAKSLEAILAAAITMSRRDGAIAGFACFSGLNFAEIVELRWKDVRWQDEAGAPFCEVRVRRRGHLTTCFVVGEGAKALLAFALASGLERSSYVLPGRRPHEHLSVGALKERVKAACETAGWPGLRRTQLTGAFVIWLRHRGLDDYAIQLTLGRRRTATVDRLSGDAASIAAQHSIDDTMPELR